MVYVMLGRSTLQYDLAPEYSRDNDRFPYGGLNYVNYNMTSPPNIVRMTAGANFFGKNQFNLAKG